MRPLVHVLFPVGLAGGSHRDLCAAAKKSAVFVEMVKRKCPECKTYTIKLKCDACGVPTIQEKTCPRCGRSLKDSYCGSCKADAVLYQRQPVNFKHLIDGACATLGCSPPKMLRGVKGLTNLDKTPEMLEKGILAPSTGFNLQRWHNSLRRHQRPPYPYHS
jgi:DNA polymerase II large subunit